MNTAEKSFGRLFVLGVGNRLMMDDGIGVYLVEHLQQQNWPGNVSFTVGETDIDYCLDICLEALQEKAKLIVLDAVVSGGRPGELSINPLNSLFQLSVGLSAHNLHFLDFLRRTHPALQGYVLGVEPFVIDYRLGLSPGLAEAFPCLLENVRRTLQSLLFGLTPGGSSSSSVILHHY